MQKTLVPVILPSVLIIFLLLLIYSIEQGVQLSHSFCSISLSYLLSISSSPTPVIQFSLFLKRKCINSLGVWACVWKPKHLPHPSHYYWFHSSWTRSPQNFRQSLGGRIWVLSVFWIWKWHFWIISWLFSCRAKNRALQEKSQEI